MALKPVLMSIQICCHEAHSDLPPDLAIDLCVVRHRPKTLCGLAWGQTQAYSERNAQFKRPLARGSSAIHGYRTSLRPSWVLAPRYPSLKTAHSPILQSLATARTAVTSGKSTGTSDDEQYPEHLSVASSEYAHSPTSSTCANNCTAQSQAKFTNPSGGPPTETL